MMHCSMGSVNAEVASRIGRSLRGVAHTQDANNASHNAIPDEVWVCGNKFPPVGARNWPATQREIYETIAGRDETVGQLASRLWVELFEINPDETKLSQRPP